jgi:hypothetical protein
MRRLIAPLLAAVAIGVLAVTADVGANHRAQPPTIASPLYTERAIRAVVVDWFGHGGRFTHSHRCGAVRQALVRMETHSDAPIRRFLGDLEALRIAVCRPGTASPPGR